MQQNILQDSNITKIYLIYIINGSKKRENVKLRFMDNRECYFAAPVSSNFNKPKKKTPAELHVFTTDGVYKTNVSLIDSNVSMREVMYEVSLPKSWNFIQLRNSTRKQVELPVNIKFNDGFEINATSYDLSLSGVSFFYKPPITSIYKKITGILTLKLPDDTLFNFPHGAMTVETKLVREKEDVEGHFGETFYIYRFMNVSYDDEDILKTFLIRLN